MEIGISLSLSRPMAQGGGGVAPSGYGFLRIGSPSSNQLVRVGADSSAPRILIKTVA